MIDVTDSFIEPRLKSGAPKLSTASSTEATKTKPARVMCVGGFWNGRTLPAFRFDHPERCAWARVEFAPKGPLVETPRYRDAGVVRGRMTRAVDHFDSVRLTGGAPTHFAEHLYTLDDDGRAYWVDLDADLVADTVQRHLEKADARAAKAEAKRLEKEAMA